MINSAVEKILNVIHTYKEIVDSEMSLPLELRDLSTIYSYKERILNLAFSIIDDIEKPQ